MAPAPDKMSRAFALPPKLLDAFERNVRRAGFSASRTVCAAVLAFLRKTPAEQAACLKRLDDRFPPETRQRASGRCRRVGRKRIVVTDKAMRLQIPPPNKQRTIG